MFAPREPYRTPIRQHSYHLAISGPPNSQRKLLFRHNASTKPLALLAFFLVLLQWGSLAATNALYVAVGHLRQLIGGFYSATTKTDYFKVQLPPQERTKAIAAAFWHTTGINAQIGYT